jgi:4-amino-4-deoxy-L-arabinose transferase-like glycosyltransferase
LIVVISFRSHVTVASHCQSGRSGFLPMTPDRLRVPRWFTWAAPVIDALADPRRSHKAIIAVLVAYTAVWTLYAVIAKSTQGIHPDMAEIAAWGLALEWGTPKHPPLLPALVQGWFSVLPATDWAYYQLAVLLVAIAIYLSWLLSGLWLDGMKRAVVPFLLMLIPFYNFLPLKLDHNVILIPLWTATTYTFVKAYRTGGAWWAAAAGLCAGGAMLAKYWSLFLLFGLGMAALIDTRRMAFFKSPTPLIITAVSLAVFLPHIAWLEGNGFPTLISARYRLAQTWGDLGHSLLTYGFGFLGYVSVPLVLLAVLAPSFRREAKSLIWPDDREGRFVAVMFWTPLLVVVPFAIATQARLSALWTMSALSLFGVLCLASPRIVITRSTAAAFATIVIALSAGALAASPIVAFFRLKGGAENEQLYTRQLARQLEIALEQEKQPQPRFLVGTYSLANSVAFYMRDRPLPVALRARVPARWGVSVSNDEFVTLCLASDRACRTSPMVHPLARWQTITVEPERFGVRGAPESFVLEIKPFVQPETDTDFCCISTSRRR